MTKAPGKYSALIFLSLIPFVLSLGQSGEYSLDIVYPGNVPQQTKVNRLEDRAFRDTLELYRAMTDLLYSYFSDGYLSAGYDSIIGNGNSYKAYLEPGMQYQMGKLEVRDLPEPGVTAVKIPSSFQAGKPLTVDRINKIRDEVVESYENFGYPFVRVSYDSVSFRDGTFNADLVIEKGPFIIIDSLVIRPDEIVSGKVLQQITGLEPGKLYSEKKIVRAGRQLANNEFLQPALPVEVGFMDDRAWVYISLAKKRSNYFDGIIGLVPASSSAGGISFTGNLDLKLNNVLKQAESFYVNWKSPSNLNQRLRTGLDLPYLSGWPVGISADLEIFKKDTSYLNTDWSAGLLAAISYNNRMGFYIRSKSSSVLLNAPSGRYRDYKTNTYGLSWTCSSIENVINPSSGFIIKAETGIGTRKTQDETPEARNDFHWESTGEAGFFLPVGIKLAVKIGTAAGFIGGKQVYRNEKYRLGGIYSLRGFDEESILADSYISGTAEIRYLFSRNSNFHIFTDAGKWWSMEDDMIREGLPFGFGLGASLETKAGVILLDYALGVAEEQPLNIRNGKIHLGFKSVF